MSPDFFVLDELSPVGGSNALAHSGAKTLVFVQQAHRGFFYQLLGISADMAGELRYPRFLLWSKVHFHGPTVAFWRNVSIE